MRCGRRALRRAISQLIWKKIGRYLLLFKTNQREPGRGKGRGRFKVERKSAPLRDGEGGLEGGLRHSPHCGASFYKVHHITSASHFHRYIIICLPPKACLLWLRILSQTRLMLAWGNRVTVSRQYLLYVGTLHTVHTYHTQFSILFNVRPRGERSLMHLSFRISSVTEHGLGVKRYLFTKNFQCFLVLAPPLDKSGSDICCGDPFTCVHCRQHVHLLCKWAKERWKDSSRWGNLVETAIWRWWRQINLDYYLSYISYYDTTSTESLCIELTDSVGLWL